MTATAAMMLEKNPALTQAQVENIIKSTALAIPPATGGGVIVGLGTQTWGADATGAGLIQVDAAIAATPP